MNQKIRKFVIPDIHGCSKTFKKLLEKINLQKDDMLYLLGDYIDRGPDSGGVLDYIIELKNNNYSVFAIQGNHERNLLETHLTYERKMFRLFVQKMNKSHNILDDFDNIKTQYNELIKSLPIYYEVDNYFLVHAGINFKSENPMEDIDGMLNIRFFEEYVPVDFPRTIIHGHNPTYLNDIKLAIEKRAKIIPLDNGCVYSKKHRFYDYTQLGCLCCLELNSWELILQTNCENE